MKINQRPFTLFFLMASTALLLSACSNSTTTSNSETGSIAFAIAWPTDVPRSAQALNDPDIDCDAAGIISVDVGVYEEVTGVLIKGDSFECSRGEGTLDGIPSGPNRSLYILGKDTNGDIKYSGEEKGITISPGVINNVGTIQLDEVDPNIDSDSDGINDDQDNCPSTPSGEVVNEYGCPDTDGDGVYDNEDECLETPSGVDVDLANGCPVDSDNDNIPDYQDSCPNSPSLDVVGPDGCSILRYTDMGDGTVKDNVTGLIWLKDANAFGSMTQNDAFMYARNLCDGDGGLTDGSIAGDWDLPTKDQLQGVGTDPPATWFTGYPSVTWTRPGDPFQVVEPTYYWSRSLYEDESVYIVSMASGDTWYGNATVFHHLWPVRSGN